MPHQNNFHLQDLIREKFSKAMSNMYKAEVPLYEDLLNIVNQINEELINAPEIQNESISDLSRINLERHGAIRLGTHEELHQISRLFNVMAMKPVGYYDLSIADLPVHSTVFRPITRESLAANPFRVFCSVLRLELLDQELRIKTEQTLEQRQIINDKCIELIDKFEKDNGLNEDDSNSFVNEAVKTFKWHEEAQVSRSFYKELLSVNSLLADIVSFKGPHINHLTPRVLDIDLLYERMSEQGIKMTDTILGPPRRKVPILLRQTSFRALSENVSFKEEDSNESKGSHRARFGEIEKRGAALTPKGFDLYKQILEKVLSQVNQADKNYKNILEQEFKEFPDTSLSLFQKKLAYFDFELNESKIDKLDIESKAKISNIINEFPLDKLAYAQDETHQNLLKLIEADLLTLKFLNYEDFLPVSAAGIFKSNIVEGGFTKASEQTLSSKEDLEQSLSQSIYDPLKLYEEESNKSLLKALKNLDKLSNND